MADTKDDITGLPDELVKVILNLCKDYEKEDKDERDNRKPLWLKLENYADGLQRRYWDSVAADWRRLPGEIEETSRHYDKIINIYRAHMESIIAALSIKLPSAVFYPEDADIIEDVETAKACSKIKNTLERYNNAKLIWIRSLLILFNTAFVAAYIYNKKDGKYGTFEKPKYGKELVKKYTTILSCAECENYLDEIVFKSETVDGKKPKITEEVKKCPRCGYNGIPNQEEIEEEVLEIVGYEKQAKSRTSIEVFSSLYVHVPFYARRQELIPYLKLEFEQHYSLLRSKYPKLSRKGMIPQGRADESSQDRKIVNFNNRNLVTTKCWWVRPWAYWLIEDEDKVKELQRRFPDGFYAVILDDHLAEIHNESLDDHWVISVDPLSEYIHGEPMGKPLAPIQDLLNETTDLQIETFEHAIPETFVDKTVLNLENYGKSRSAPGMVYGVVRPADGTIASSFHTVKTATLSEETDVFARRLDDKGQFVLGSFPSIYGGPAASGSKTAREYTESRAMALQRLTIRWNQLKHWWANVMAVAVPLAINALKSTGQDEKFVDKNESGPGFTNIWIRQYEIAGSIGRVEADAEADLPQSPGQMKDLIVQLMTLKDENINEALFHPNNTPFIAKALGTPDIYIPGAEDRDYQYAEISDLLQGIEVTINEYDNDPVHIEVCRTWLSSGSALMLKRTDPDAVARVEMHWKAHVDKMMAKMQPGLSAAARPAPAPGAVSPDLGAVNV